MVGWWSSLGAWLGLLGHSLSSPFLKPESDDLVQESHHHFDTLINTILTANVIRFDTDIPGNPGPDHGISECLDFHVSSEVKKKEKSYGNFHPKELSPSLCLVKSQT